MTANDATTKRGQEPFSHTLKDDPTHRYLISTQTLQVKGCCLQQQQQYGARPWLFDKEIMAHEKLGQSRKGMDGRTAQGGGRTKDEGTGETDSTRTGTR
eukprot:scaffold22692_cov198-Cylindrotheca_fusiformis.AAC.5